MSHRPESEIAGDARRLLDDLLRRVSFRAEVFFRGQLCGAWSVDTAGSGKVSFHLVGHGACWLHLPYLDQPMSLGAGDVLVFPHDSPHLVSSSPDRPGAFGVRDAEHVAPLDPSAEGTGLVCGYLDLEPTARRLLFAGLPGHLVFGHGGADAERLQMLVALVFAEARADGVGSAALLDRLADALLLYVVREAVSRDCPPVGVLGVLRDSQLWPVLDALFARPEQHWTVDALAKQAHLSRSSFSERFQAAAGMGPIELLTLWRMHIARSWIEDRGLSVAIAADRCGYRSEGAFSKAFKRVVGVSPGSLRRQWT